MIRVCRNCSHVDNDKLEKMLPGHIQVECIGECGQHAGKIFGYINDQFVLKDTEQEFFEAVKSVHL